MIQGIFSKFFQKNEVDNISSIASTDTGKFVLKLNHLEIGYLEYQSGIWYFCYSDLFKQKTNYHSIPGFPNVNKKYANESLWPFFKIRIPGMGQPSVKDILTKENINRSNEFALLKRFGLKSISNPYTLEFIEN